jgi:endonuclease G
MMRYNVKKMALTIGIFLLIPFFLRGQDHGYAPKVRDVLVRNTHYCIDFNPEHKQPNWVYYILTSAHITGTTPRSSTFNECRQGAVSSASLKDYKGSGYDRGHLCPAADMKISKEAMTATFQMWNMSPQNPSFNRGRWADLEAKMRKYIADGADTVFIVTGPVFINNKGSIGDGKVTVPGFFYKVVYSPERGGAGFLMPNEKLKAPLQSWQVSIDLIEALTGIDFFPQLPTEREDKIEAQVEWWE